MQLEKPKPDTLETVYLTATRKPARKDEKRRSRGMTVYGSSPDQVIEEFREFILTRQRRRKPVPTA